MGNRLKMAAERCFSAIEDETASEFKLFVYERYQDGSFKFVGEGNIVMDTLNRFRRNREAEFCDVVLEVEGKSKCFKAHRCILAANSQYFYSMFTIGMEDSNKRRIELNHLSSKAVEAILDYFYTRSITVTLQNVEELLEAASFLLVDAIKEACSTVLKESLKDSNWYSLKHLAEIFTLPELKKKADDFITKSFHTVVHGSVNEGFLDLPVEVLADVISRDELMVEKEEDVYSAVLDWVRHDAENRKDCLQELLKLLRYGSLSNGFLHEQLGKEPLLRDNLQCSTLLREQMSTIMKKERTSTKNIPVIVGVEHNKAFCHDVESNTSYYLPAPPGFPVKDNDFIFMLNVAVEQNTIFVNSARHGTDWPFQKCSLANYGKMLCWQELPQCNFEKDFTRLAVLKGLVYMYTRDENSRVVECFDPHSNQWSQVASLQSQYEQFQVVGTDSHMFVIGRKTSSVSEYGEQSVEKYDPGKDKWVYAAPFQRIKPVYQAVYANEKIYATGYIHNGDIDGCEVYTPSINEWWTVAPPGVSVGALLNIDNDICVVFGHEEQAGKTGTLKYDPDNDEWQEFEVFGSKDVSSFTLCSMKIKTFYLKSFPVAPPKYFLS